MKTVEYKKYQIHEVTQKHDDFTIANTNRRYVRPAQKHAEPKLFTVTNFVKVICFVTATVIIVEIVKGVLL